MIKQKNNQLTSVTVGTKTYYVGSVHPIKFMAAGLLAVLFAVLFTLPLSFYQEAHALALTWDGGGADNNWTTCANWSSDTCPGSGDALTFNSTSTKDSTVDASFAGVITSINITTGYSGTVTLARSLQTTSTFTQSTGTFTASSFLLDVDGAFSATGGTFNASSGSMTFAAAFTTGASVTFNHNSGTVTFDGGTSATLTCNSKTFNLVTFNNSALKTVASTCTFPLGANPNVAGSGQITSAGTFSGSGTFTRPGGGGQLSFSAGAVLSGFTGISAVNFGVAGATLDLSGYSSFVTSGTTSISSGSLTLPNGADLNSALSITGGTFNAPSGTMTVAGALTISGSPTFNANSGTITFDGSGANVTLSCNSVTFANVTFAHTVNTKVVSSNCSMPVGASPTLGTGTASITLSGTLSGSGTLATTGTLTINSGAVLSGFSGYTATGLTVTGATIDFSSYSPFSTAGTFTIQTSANVTLPVNADINNTFALSTSSTLNMPNGSVYFAGAVTLNSGTTFNAGIGTVVFDGTATATITCNSATFNFASFTHTTGTRTVSSGCTLPLGYNPTSTGTIGLSGTLSGTGTFTEQGTITINSTGVLSGFTGLVVETNLVMNGGTLDASSYTTFDVNGITTLSTGTLTAPSGNMNLAGIFIVVSGFTFNHNNGTVIFDGTNSVTLSCMGITFNKVVFANTAGTKYAGPNCTMPLGANPTVGQGGDVELRGTFSGTGTLSTSDSSNFKIFDYGTLSGFTGLDVGNLIVSGTTLSLSGYSDVSIAGDFTLQNGATFTAPSGTFYIAGDLITQSGTSSLRLPGVRGENASTPDSAAVSIAGDIDIRVYAALDKWALGAAQGLLAKFDATGSNQRSYQIQIDASGFMFFEASANGSTTGYSATSTAAVTGYDGTPVWTRTTRNATTGDVKFYTSTDGSSWTQLGTTVTATAGAMFDGTAVLVVGEKNNSISPASGSFYRAQVRSNILDDGTGIVFDTDFSNHATGTTSFAESSSNAATVTINGSYAKIFAAGTSSFNANNGTVNLNGGDQAIQGDWAFNNLTKEVTSSQALTMPASGTVSVAGLLTLKGTSYNAPISVVSSSTGTRWNIARNGTSSILYAYIKDGNSTNGTILACKSVNGGNNINFAFNASDCDPAVASSSSSSSSSSTSSDAATEEAVTTDTEVTPTTNTIVDTSDQETNATQKSFGQRYKWQIIILSLVIAAGGIWWLILLARRRRQDEDEVY